MDQHISVGFLLDRVRRCLSEAHKRRFQDFFDMKNRRRIDFDGYRKRFSVFYGPPQQRLQVLFALLDLSGDNALDTREVFSALRCTGERAGCSPEVYVATFPAEAELRPLGLEFDVKRPHSQPHALQVPPEVSHVDILSSAYAAGVRALDRLVTVNGVDCRTYTMDEVEVILRSTRPLELHLVTAAAWPSCEHFLSGSLTLGDWGKILTAVQHGEQENKLTLSEYLSYFTVHGELGGYWSLVRELTGFQVENETARTSPGLKLDAEHDRRTRQVQEQKAHGNVMAALTDRRPGGFRPVEVLEFAVYSRYDTLVDLDGEPPAQQRLRGFFEQVLHACHVPIPEPPQTFGDAPTQRQLPCLKAEQLASCASLWFGVDLQHLARRLHHLLVSGYGDFPSLTQDDAGRRQLLSFAALNKHWSALMTGTEHEHRAFAFALFDIDGDGVISPHDAVYLRADLEHVAAKTAGEKPAHATAAAVDRAVQQSKVLTELMWLAGVVLDRASTLEAAVPLTLGLFRQVVPRPCLFRALRASLDGEPYDDRRRDARPVVFDLCCPPDQEVQ